VRAALFIAGLLLGLATGFVGGREYGRYHGFLELNQLRYKEDQQAIAPFLASDAAFQRIVTLNDKNSGISLAGYVSTQQDYDRLRIETLRLFGEPRVAFIMRDVSVHRSVEPGAVSGRDGK
jgi:hypothetical protein